MFMRVLTASALTIALMTSALAGGSGHGSGGGGQGPGGGGHSASAGSHGPNGGSHSHGIGSRGGDHAEGAADPANNIYYGGQNYMGYGWGGPCAPYQNC
jgi:hypothetical protein